MWPKIGGNLSAFETGEYTEKRLELFEEIEAKPASSVMVTLMKVQRFLADREVDPL